MSGAARRPLILAAAAVAILVVGMAAGAFVAGRFTAQPVAKRTANSAPNSPLPALPPGASPTPTVRNLPFGTAGTCPTGTLVHDGAELTQALSSAQPGSVIVMAPGTYAGQFVAAVTGTAGSPITLCGPRDAVIDGGDIKLGYSLHLNKVDWWRVIGFTIKGGQKGVVTDMANHNLISGLYVHDIGDEGIHLRDFSSDNVVDGNTVRNTGLLVAKFGEGIYVGTANSNWTRFSQGQVDNSDRDVIKNNDVANTTAENIDIKEGTTGGVIQNNHLDGTGLVQPGASAWINVKGNNWTIVGNTGQHSPKDGFQVHEVYKGWGYNNIFRANHAEVDGPGYGFYSQHRSLATVVTCDNTAVGAAKGLSNIGCTSA